MSVRIIPSPDRQNEPDYSQTTISEGMEQGWEIGLFSCVLMLAVLELSYQPYRRSS